MREYAQQFYHSDAWHKCRNAYKQKRMLIDGGLCEECRLNQGYIVHHKIYITEKNINEPSITLNEDNLMYVCKECHDSYDGHGVHGRKGKASKVIFDEHGMPIARKNKKVV